MKYNFNDIIDRKNTNCSKWDNLKSMFKSDDMLALWIADLDFAMPPFVHETLKKRLEHPILGYGVIKPESLQVIVDFYKSFTNFEFKPEDLIFCPGVLTIAYNFLQIFTQEGDEILFDTPGYYQLTNVINNNNRKPLLTDLVYNSKTGEYSFDFDAIEAKITPKTKAWFLCSPQNPTGRVWNKKELQEIERITEKHNLYVLADEIHGLLNFKKGAYIPFASFSDKTRNRTITATSPSKFAGLAGLVYSMAIIPNKTLFDKFKAQTIAAGLEFTQANVLGFTGFLAAYHPDNKIWFKDLMEYLEKNKDFAIQFFKEKMPKVLITPSEASFLLWANFNGLNLTPTEIKNKMDDEAKVAVHEGKVFGENWAGFYRINIGCPQNVLKEGLERMYNTFKNH